MIDTGLRHARSPCAVAGAYSQRRLAITTTVVAPLVHPAPPAHAQTSHAPEPDAIAGRDVWLVHPWSLADPPDGVPVAIFDLDFHQRWPWSELRWQWVMQRAQAITGVCWIASGHELVAALAAAQRVHGWADPHLPWLADAAWLPYPQRPFVEPAIHCCQSFSAWFSRLSGFADAATPVRSRRCSDPCVGSCLLEPTVALCLTTGMDRLPVPPISPIARCAMSKLETDYLIIGAGAAGLPLPTRC